MAPAINVRALSCESSRRGLELRFCESARTPCQTGRTHLAGDEHCAAVRTAPGVDAVRDEVGGQSDRVHAAEKIAAGLHFSTIFQYESFLMTLPPRNSQ